MGRDGRGADPRERLARRRRLALDGCRAKDGGKTWSSIDDQPTGQFYRVAVDDRFPYRVYGAQQDSSTVAIASRARGREIGRSASDLKYRIQWNAPILVSRHDPNVLWHAAQVLLESRDEGQGWKEISPDLAWQASFLAEAAKALESRLLAAESKLVNPKLKSSQDVLNFPPALDHQIVGLVSAVSSADAPPTAGALTYWAELKGTLSAAEADAKEVLERGVACFNTELAAAGVSPVEPLRSKVP